MYENSRYGFMQDIFIVVYGTVRVNLVLIRRGSNPAIQPAVPVDSSFGQ